MVAGDRDRSLVKTAPSPQKTSVPTSPATSAIKKPAPKATSNPIVANYASPSLPKPERIQELKTLQDRAEACMKCSHLASSRTNVVFGVGNPEADIMFVGEAPGWDEDRAGEPFVGKAGQLLTKIILAMGLQRDEVYIANILKCRPDTPNQRFGNRKPTSSEMSTCLPYLQAQIDIIQPKLLVALGATAVEGLLDFSPSITRIRGQWHEYRRVPLMPTYHPSYVLRRGIPQVKRQIWEDMLATMELLEMPISEKQRGYFLPKN